MDLTSDNKGFLPPRVSLVSSTDVNTIKNPATGLIVYNIGTSTFAAGYYYFNGTEWSLFVKASGSSDSSIGSSIRKQRLTTAGSSVILTSASGLFSFRLNGGTGTQWQIRYNSGSGTRPISVFISENWTTSGQSSQSGNVTLTANTWTNFPNGTASATNELNIFRIYDNTDGRIIIFEGIIINSSGVKESMIVEEF
ncbi:hypothetical protein [Chishuiella sp.]|uniref:hypothetical protein n=1 Tax=Chishuiella sp. TaxID=1969467 RepID=UPI0028B1ECDC|nr:hypothetical protein [Chishuiella sp.]